MPTKRISSSGDAVGDVPAPGLRGGRGKGGVGATRGCPWVTVGAPRVAAPAVCAGRGKGPRGQGAPEPPSQCWRRRSPYGGKTPPNRDRDSAMAVGGFVPGKGEQSPFTVSLLSPGTFSAL